MYGASASVVEGSEDRRHVWWVAALVWWRAQRIEDMYGASASVVEDSMLSH